MSDLIWEGRGRPGSCRSLHRREFVRRLGAALGLGLMVGCRPSPPIPRFPTPELKPTAKPTQTTQARVMLTFLHTNDTHGHLAPFRLTGFSEPVGGIARRATLVRRIRAQVRHVLLVDAGDVLQGCLMADAFRGEPDIEFMNELGYVAMGLGNHDLDYGWDNLLQRKKEAFFPILCANLLHADDGRPALDEHLIVHEGGVRVAFTSFAGPDWRRIVNPRNIPGLVIADPAAIARELIPRLHAEADLVVVLGHQLLQDDLALLGKVPGIDVLIGGHEHARLDKAVQVGNALLVEAHQWGAYLGRLDVAVEGGKIVGYSYGLIPVTADIPADPTVEARVGELQSELRLKYPERFAVIGRAAEDIPNEGIRSRESPLGNLICDAVRHRTQAEAVFIASSCMLNSLFAGPLMVQDICDALPCEDEIVISRLKGELIQRVLDFSASASGGGGFSQVSGLRFTIIGGVAAAVTVGERPLDLRREYIVASTGYQVRRATGYAEILEGSDWQGIGVTVRKALIEYIKANTPINASVDGRITIG